MERWSEHKTFMIAAICVPTMFAVCAFLVALFFYVLCRVTEATCVEL